MAEIKYKYAVAVMNMMEDENKLFIVEANNEVNALLEAYDEFNKAQNIHEEDFTKENVDYLSKIIYDPELLSNFGTSEEIFLRETRNWELVFSLPIKIN